MTTSPEAPKKTRTFGRTYWMLNTIEMFERLAYFSMRAVVPVYIMQADDPGGLHFTAAMKGTIYAWWFIFQSILPTFTGGYADRYGYKKTLFVSFTLNIIGYLMMANLRSYPGFFAGVIVLASGTALFKPALQGSLAQNLTKLNSSVGWGIFYWVVNIGAAIGPFLATAILGDPHTQTSWRNLFTASAIITSLNYIMLFTFRDVPSGADKTESPIHVMRRTLKNIVEPRLVAWLLIMSCFWLMMYQLWDLHPNFIEDWVDSSPIARILPFEQWKMHTARGVMVPQQILLNLNALFIILFMVPVSWMVRRMRVLACMVIGMAVAMIGILVAGFTASGWVLLLGIVFFSTGEMMTGPKKNEYLGLIAPPGKKALYLGYVNIPVGIGGFVGSKMAGYLYGHYGEKATLALRYIAEKKLLGEDKAWDGSIRTLEATLGVSRTEAVARLQELTGMDAVEVTRMLWAEYHPQYYVWIPFAMIGLGAIVALVIFSQMAKRWKDMDA
ncbi:MAG: MFS transporter [Candidatus Eisenbacteria bacterium]|nr:MFS transporter [Candidatus Eisenbacteria bacterium]